MKQLLFILFFSYLLTLKCQYPEYTLISNNTKTYPHFSLSTDIIGFDAGARHDRLNWGFWGYYELPKNDFGFNFLARRTFLFIVPDEKNNEIPSHEFDFGFYNIDNKFTKRKKIKVHFSYLSPNRYKVDIRKDYVNSDDILVPVDISHQFGLRIGLNHKSGQIDFRQKYEKINIINFEMRSIISSQAIYLGIFKRKFYDFTVRIKPIANHDYIFTNRSIGQEFYFDAVISLRNSFKFDDDENLFKYKKGDDVTKLVKSNFEKKIPGFRMGVRYFQNCRTNEFNKLVGKSISFETGYRPFLGIYFSGGIGITLFRNIKPIVHEAPSKE